MVEIGVKMMCQNAGQRIDIRHRDDDVLLQPPGAQQGRIDPVGEVRRCDDNHAFRFQGTIEKFEQAIDQRGPVIVIGATAITAPCPATDAVQLIDQQDTRGVRSCCLECCLHALQDIAEISGLEP